MSDSEWKDAVLDARNMLEKELNTIQKELRDLNHTVGRRKLRRTIMNIQKLEKEAKSILDPEHQAPDLKDTIPMPIVQDYAHKDLLDKARHALSIQQRITLLQTRLSCLKSRTCTNVTNKQCCPEIYLSAISRKLINTSVMFIWIELLNEFYFTFPRELENKMYYALDKNAILEFANENGNVKRHLDVQRKCEVLDEVMEKIRDLMRSTTSSTM
jgi:hypothetical protein